MTTHAELRSGTRGVPERMATGFRIGRAMSAVAVISSIYGLAALILIGRTDHITQDYIAAGAVLGVGFGALTWLAVPRQPQNRTVWVFALASLFNGLGTAGWATAILITHLAGLDASLAGWYSLSPVEVPAAAAWSYGVFTILVMPGVFLIISLGLLLFPDGKLSSPGWKWPGWLAVAAMTGFSGALTWVWRPSSSVPYGATSDEFPPGGRLVSVLLPIGVALTVVCIGGFITGFRRSTGVVRQQYRWVGWGGGALVLVMVAVTSTQPAVPTGGGWQLWLMLAAIAFLTASFGVAVLKYRLYDIDLVISKAFVYGVLAAFIGAVYVLVVVVLGDALSSGAGNLGLSVAATAIVAIAFEPVRKRAQRWANRLVYGRRATPYEVLSELTRRLAGTEPAQGVLDRMVRMMAEGTGAEQATVWLSEGSRLVAAVGWPHTPIPSEVASPDALSGETAQVVHDDSLVGVLEVAKTRGNPVTPTERRLLEDLAGSTGLILGNERLNADLSSRASELRASRRRLVEIQDSERRRLERDLHDGAQQQVVALKLKIGLAEHVARNKGANQLSETLTGLGEEAQKAVDEIRRLARGIYPPLLESENLSTAISSAAASLPIPVQVDATVGGPLPKDLESAVYFAAVEAMANAVRHGNPSLIRVHLNRDHGILVLRVNDDGDGFDQQGFSEGAGLLSVRDRVESLDGEIGISSAPGSGTTLQLRIPVDKSGGVSESEGSEENRLVLPSV